MRTRPLFVAVHSGTSYIPSFASATEFKATIEPSDFLQAGTAYTLAIYHSTGVSTHNFSTTSQAALEASTQSLVAFSQKLLSLGSTAAEGTLAIERKANELLFLPLTSPTNTTNIINWSTDRGLSLGSCQSSGTCGSNSDFLDLHVFNFFKNLNAFSYALVIAPKSTSITNSNTSGIYFTRSDIISGPPPVYQAQNYAYNLQFIDN